MEDGPNEFKLGPWEHETEVMRWFAPVVALDAVDELLEYVGETLAEVLRIRTNHQGGVLRGCGGEAGAVLECGHEGSECDLHVARARCTRRT